MRPAARRRAGGGGDASAEDLTAVAGVALWGPLLDRLGVVTAADRRGCARMEELDMVLAQFLRGVIGGLVLLAAGSLAWLITRTINRRA